MPITFGGSNIIIEYNTGGNYIIESVKSDLYVRDSRTGISSNLTGEPVVTPPIFTDTIQTFTHSGGTETQTTYDITIPQNTICDILMIGGGGGGGKDRAGGGGAGALILSIGNILSGTYNIRVGNKGLGSTTAANGDNGYDCEIYKSDGTIIFRAKGGGGGQSLNGVNVSDGGCGGGKTSQFTGLGGIAVSTNVVNGITTGPVITTTYGVYGNVGGRNTTPYVSPNLNNLDGAGGGGIGEGGSTSGTTLVPVDNQFVVNNGGKGGDGLYFATINGTTYNFKNYFNVNGVQDGTTGNFFIGGGGGGGDYGVGSSGASGKGGGGAGGEQTTTGANATGFGSGGGGGGGDNYNGGNGSAGIVVIKLRNIVNAAIPEGNPITHKTLNFTYTVAQPTYTLNFPVPTTTDILDKTAGRGILNNSNLILHGTYDINLTASSAQIIPRTGQYLPFTATSNLSQNIAFRYHLLNPIKVPGGAQWTYNSSNANVYHLGNVGIGTTNPSYNLDIKGTIFSSTGGYTQSGLTTWTVMSDRRIKENIVKASYDKCLENVKNIDLYSFNFKDNCVHTNDKNQLGFIAQEVQQVYPKAVEVGRMILNTNETINDVLTLNTTQINYTLYGAVKYLIQKVEMLEQQLEKNNVITNSSNVITNSSNVITNSSNVSTNSSNVITNSSNVITNSSNSS